jgi:CBS domain-containing membrane protein
MKPTPAYRVKDLMTRAPLTLLPEEDLGLADTILAMAHVRHLPVVDRRGLLLGILTHRDILRAWAERGERASRTIPASAVMTTSVQTVTPNTPLREALEALATEKIGCVVVVDSKNKVVGILTEHDGVKFALQMASDIDKAFSRFSQISRVA